MNLASLSEQIRLAHDFKVYFRNDFVIKIGFTDHRFISSLHTEVFKKEIYRWVSHFLQPILSFVFL